MSSKPGVVAPAAAAEPVPAQTVTVRAGRTVILRRRALSLRRY
jgi:hypothetical protein